MRALRLQGRTGHPERGRALERARSGARVGLALLKRAQAPASRFVRRHPLAALATVFVALSLAATFSSQPGRYVEDARLEHVTAPEQYLTRHAYLWDDERGLGKPISHFYFSPAPAAFQAALGALGAQPWVIERLTHALFLSLAALGVIVLMREFFPRIGVVHAVAAFVYTFSPLTSQLLIPSGIFLYYAFAPWLTWIALRGVRDDDPWRWAAAFALALAAVGTINVAPLGFAFVPAALTGLYVSVYERRGLKRLWSWAWRSGFLGVLTGSASIVVLWFSAPDVSANLRATELPDAVARTSSWFESWRGLGFWLTYPFIGGLLRPNATPYFTEPGVVAACFVAPLGALITLALGRWRHRLLFGAMLLLSLVLMVGMHGVEGDPLQRSAGGSPFGHLLSFLFEQSEIARGFRTTYKAGAGLMLAIAALLGVGVSYVVAAALPGRRVERSAVRLLPRVRRLAPIFVVAAVTLGIVVASFPFWTGRLYPEELGFRSIPRYWERTFEYLDAQDPPGRVMVLPAPERGRYRWGEVNDNLFDGLSPLSPVRNSAFPQETSESADLVAAIDEYASSSGYVKGTLGPILARLGVRWVLLQNDIQWHGSLPRPSTYDALRADPDLRLAKTLGRRGKNVAVPGDVDAGFLGEASLPPVEVYEVAGSPSPEPRLTEGPPLVVAGGGESWPSLAAAGLLDGPPVAYTGAAEDETLRRMVASDSDLVVTDGNRRRATAVTIGRPNRSPTLAADESAGRPPDDLFGSVDTQSVATYGDARRISASRSGNELEAQYEAWSRPANAFDRVERTAWTVGGPIAPTGVSLSVELREPEAVTAVSALPYADGSHAVKEIDVITRTEDGERTRKRLRFTRGERRLPVARFDGTEVSGVELRIARVVGIGGSLGITEAVIGTPNGQLDLREFVRTPNDLAIGAAADERLAATLAARPPRYELRRITGVNPQRGGDAARDEETELRREITAFGDHRYQLGLTARLGRDASDSAIDSLLGAPVGAVGTSRFNGGLGRRGGLVVDDQLATGWEPEAHRRQRVDLHFPATEVRTLEVLVFSKKRGPRARSRVRQINVGVGDRTETSRLPRSRQCLPESPPRGCLEAHVVNVPPTYTDDLSVTLTGIDPTLGRFGPFPPRVVEVRINGLAWSELADSSARENCAPLFAVDGRAANVRLPGDADEMLAGRVLELEGCEPIRLKPGRHRIETLPGLSGAVLTASLVSQGDERGRARDDRSSNPGTVELVDRSPTRQRLQVDAARGALLVGGMPWHEGWVVEGADLRRSPVPLDTFGAWTVEAPIAEPVTLQFEPQRAYELAIALSIASAAWCLWRVARRRKGSPR